MYGIYANIGGILMVNVTIYSIHGSYGYWINMRDLCIFWGSIKTVFHGFHGVDFDTRGQEVERCWKDTMMQLPFTRIEKVTVCKPSTTYHKRSWRDKEFTLILKELHSVLGQLQTTMHHAQEELEEAGPTCTGDIQSTTCFDGSSYQNWCKKVASQTRRIGMAPSLYH